MARMMLFIPVWIKSSCYAGEVTLIDELLYVLYFVSETVIASRVGPSSDCDFISNKAESHSLVIEVVCSKTAQHRGRFQPWKDDWLDHSCLTSGTLRWAGIIESSRGTCSPNCNSFRPESRHRYLMDKACDQNAIGFRAAKTTGQQARRSSRSLRVVSTLSVAVHMFASVKLDGQWLTVPNRTHQYEHTWESL